MRAKNAVDNSRPHPPTANPKTNRDKTWNPGKSAVLDNFQPGAPEGRRDAGNVGLTAATPLKRKTGALARSPGRFDQHGKVFRGSASR